MHYSDAVAVVPEKPRGAKNTFVFRAPGGLLPDFDLDIACICRDLAFAAGGGVRDTDGAGVALGEEYLIGGKGTCNIARIRLYFELFGIAGLKANVAGGAGQKKASGGANTLQKQISRAAGRGKIFATDVRKLGLAGGYRDRQVARTGDR